MLIYPYDKRSLINVLPENCIKNGKSNSSFQQHCGRELRNFIFRSIKAVESCSLIFVLVISAQTHKSTFYNAFLVQ